MLNSLPAGVQDIERTIVFRLYIDNTFDAHLDELRLFQRVLPAFYVHASATASATKVEFHYDSDSFDVAKCQKLVARLGFEDDVNGDFTCHGEWMNAGRELQRAFADAFKRSDELVVPEDNTKQSQSPGKRLAGIDLPVQSPSKRRKVAFLNLPAETGNAIYIFMMQEEEMHIPIAGAPMRVPPLAGACRQVYQEFAAFYRKHANKHAQVVVVDSHNFEDTGRLNLPLYLRRPVSRLRRFVLRVTLDNNINSLMHWIRNLAIATAEQGYPPYDIEIDFDPESFDQWAFLERLSGMVPSVVASASLNEPLDRQARAVYEGIREAVLGRTGSSRTPPPILRLRPAKPDAKPKRSTADESRKDQRKDDEGAEGSKRSK
ncbi:uncharacterized protein LTR77_004795 [Saxophila tyrrhenica]|uniref:Uncharacterized protein n=1 Tax=Saxophila tyrrhenica TaxID=1690608 RepID=A0AAV9PCI3_9PEZI|nr:hypothetical protein LTR77_004795 [Saxophila tyrrhenica]